MAKCAPDVCLADRQDPDMPVHQRAQFDLPMWRSNMRISITGALMAAALPVHFEETTAPSHMEAR